MDTPHWDACILEPNSILRWAECHPGSSGYLQAFGLITTVVVTLVFVPILNQRRRTQRAAAAILALLGDVLALQAETQRVSLALDRQRVDPPGVKYHDWFAEIRLAIPSGLEAAYPLIADLSGKKSAAVLHCLVYAKTYNGNAERFRAIAMQTSGQDWFDLVTQIKENLATVFDATNDFLVAIGSTKAKGV
jgi:hypothetical protein